MIPYTTYKLIHLFSIFIFLSGGAVLLIAERKPLWLRVAVGLASFGILLGGMGLVARLGDGFQPWVWAKLGIWFVITGISHMVAKRFPQFAWHAYGMLLLGAGAAAWLAIYKPF